MTINPEDTPLADEVPVADAVEQQQPAALGVEDAGLDPSTSPTDYRRQRLRRD
jgi:hypothetical protein